MDNETKDFIQRSVREGIAQALGQINLKRDVQTYNQETFNPLNVDDDIFTFDAQSFEDGIEIPEEIFRWFPKTSSQGKLSKDMLRKILKKNPEPSQGILKAPKLDRYLRSSLSREDIENDETLAMLHNSIGQILRPIISMAITTDNTEYIGKLKQSILLAVDAMARISIDRKRAILKALKFDEANIKYWCQKHSETREWLFGGKFQEELNIREGKRFQSSLLQLFMGNARTKRP